MSKFDQSPKSEISFLKRRDPKSMSMEELDEFINKNKTKIKNEDSKLNASFTSYSLKEVQKNLNKTTDNIMRKDTDSKSFIINHAYNPFLKDSNVSYDPVPDSEDRFRNKNNHNTATNSYIKALQEKIRHLTVENEEAKRNFIEVSELLENV
jgi:hypothetical protein